MKPQFVTFEGGEGSGKSTQSRKLHEYLLANGIKSIHTREVGGTREAEEIRNILIHKELYNVSELLLVMAARYEHINKVIVPALLEGKWVICDRFVDSTACYQSDAYTTIKEIFALHNKLIKSKETNKPIMPDITFFMDISPKEGLERSMQTGEINKFENKDTNFHDNIYKKFKTIANMYPDRIKRVSCYNRRIEEIHQDIVDVINSR